jgi:hypothetical protein
MKLEEIEKRGNLFSMIAKKMRELIPLVEEAYPGYSVYIDAMEPSQHTNGTDSKPNGTVINNKTFAALTKTNQIATILEHAGRPMQKREILNAVRQHGGDMSVETLNAYLSRRPFFRKEGKGLWRLEVGGSNFDFQSNLPSRSTGEIAAETPPRR